MKTLAVLGALFLALFGMVHLGWSFFGPEGVPSPVAVLLVAIGPTVITIALYAAGTAATGFVLAHSWMAMRHGFSWAENNRRPPKNPKAKENTEGDDDRFNRKAASILFGIVASVVGAGFMLWGSVNAQVIVGTIYVWFVLGAQVRLFLARQAEKN